MMDIYWKDPGVLIDLLTLVVLGSILLSCYRKGKTDPAYASSFRWMLCLSLLQTVSDLVYVVVYTNHFRRLLYCFASLSYGLGYAITFSFCIFLYRFCRSPQEDNWLWRDVIVFAGLGFAVQILAIVVLCWQGVLFGFPRDIGLLKLPQRALILYGFTLLTLILNACVVMTRKMLLKKKIILCVYCLIPLMAIPLMILGVRRSQCFVLVQNVLIYCHIFAEQSKDLAETEAELINSRMETMLSQIQPHFLYNALNSCVSLCDDDPQLAKQTLLDFSRYLRSNLDSLGKKEPIPFMREIEHTRTYLHIEQIRFGDKVKVEYDLQETDFLLPALTLQPLVENAVKHGITMKRGGGTVTIRSYGDRENWYVLVEDDGVGFEKLPEGREHIGVRNIQGRLAAMVGGTLSYESKINIGTKALITLPKKGTKP